MTDLELLQLEKLLNKYSVEFTSNLDMSIRDVLEDLDQILQG